MWNAVDDNIYDALQTKRFRSNYYAYLQDANILYDMQTLFIVTSN